MDTRQQVTRDALYRLDPELAGLFANACDLLDRIDQPGVSYLVGHAGRELSRAVLDLVARELPIIETGPKELTSGEPNALRAQVAAVLPVSYDEDSLDRFLGSMGEDQRRVISRALALNPEHPLVSAWFKAHKQLLRVTHYRPGGSPPFGAAARNAFLQLAGLLHSRIAPYFEAQAELDAIMRAGSPSSDDLARLSQLLVRPQLRFRFFRSIHTTEWLEPLIGMHVFDHPPELVTSEDGFVRLMPWPEGEFLVKIASEAPEGVIRVLLTIPMTLKNPVVWDVVARAARNLPPPASGNVVRRVTEAVKDAGPGFFRYNTIELATFLAEAAPTTARPLVLTLLGVKGPPPPPEKHPEWVASERSAAMLERITLHEASEILKKVIPALARHDPIATWALLVERLQRAQRLAAEGGLDDDHRSHAWCDSLETTDSDDDFRAQLAVAAMRVAMAVLSGDATRVGEFLSCLPNTLNGLFGRMRLALLVRAGDQVLDHLDAVIADPGLLDPPSGAREVAALLRAQFGNASSAAREAFVSALIAGPDPWEAPSTFVADADPEAADPKSDLENWQRQRLRWFHERIPTGLGPLADELGVKAEKPSYARQELDEVGWYSSSGARAEGRSPLHPDELRAMPIEDLIQFIRRWEPPDPSDDWRQVAETKASLALAFAESVTDGEEVRAEAISAVASGDDLPPAFRRALLAGLRRRAERKASIPWREALRLVETTLRLGEPGRTTSGIGAWDVGRSDAVGLLATGCSANLLLGEHESLVFQMVADGLASSLDWVEEGRKINQFGDVIQGTLSTDAGRIAELVLEVALWTYHRSGGAMNQANNVLFRGWLELLRVRQDAGRIAIRGQFGRFLPQILLIDHDWVLLHADDLLAGGMTDPLHEPVWGAYLTLSPLFDKTFADLRPWYDRHSAESKELVALEKAQLGADRDWSISRHFLRHLGSAFLQGYVGLGDPSLALENVFAASKGEDRDRFYWSVNRGWSDSEEPPASEMVERLLQLWNWRLSQLESDVTIADGAEEADGLGWLIMTRHLPDDAVAALAPRTLRIGPATRGIRGMIWPRIVELGIKHAAAVVEMSEILIQAGLEDPYPHFDFTEIAPALALGLTSGQEQLVSRTRWLIHRLGDHGETRFGTLLESGESSV